MAPHGKQEFRYKDAQVLLTAWLLAGQSVPPCSAAAPDAVQNQRPISFSSVEGVAWPTCNSLMCGGLAGSEPF